MKALLINGSARANGNTRIALEEVGKTPCTSSAEAAQTSECILLYAPVNIALSLFMFNALNNYFKFLFSILNKIPLRQKVATLVVRINLLTSPVLLYPSAMSRLCFGKILTLSHISAFTHSFSAFCLDRGLVVCLRSAE